MARRPLARATAWIAASILAVGCGGNDSGVAGSAGGSEDVAADSDSGEDFDRDESAATMFRQLSDVGNPDRWFDRLVRAEIGEIDGGFAIAGYDEHGNVIGQVSVTEIGPNLIAIDHRYPRPCDVATPAEDCADALYIVLDFINESAQVDSNASPALFSDRATAIVAKLPPDEEISRMRCTLWLAAAAAACGSIGVAGPIAIPVCFKQAHDAYCECGVYQRQFPKVWTGRTGAVNSMNAPKSSFVAVAVILCIATIAAIGLLILAAVDTQSVRAWSKLILPLTMALGTFLAANRARGRGEQESAAQLLVWGALANACIAALA